MGQSRRRPHRTLSGVPVSCPTARPPRASRACCGASVLAQCSAGTGIAPQRLGAGWNRGGADCCGHANRLRDFELVTDSFAGDLVDREREQRSARDLAAQRECEPTRGRTSVDRQRHDQRNRGTNSQQRHEEHRKAPPMACRPRELLTDPQPPRHSATITPRNRTPSSSSSPSRPRHAAIGRCRGERLCRPS